MKKTTASRGFTIIETLVALSIFTFAILGLIVITSQGIADTNFSKNKLIATYLAQEGIEVVRNMRDSTLLSGGSWTDLQDGQVGFCFVSGTVTGCDIDAKTLTIDSCTTNARSCGPLRYDATDGSYVLNSLNAAIPETPFSRLISLTSVGQNEISITSTVSWYQGTVLRHVTMNETLADWIAISPIAPPSSQ